MSEQTVSKSVAPSAAEQPTEPIVVPTRPKQHIITPVTLSWAEEYAASRRRALDRTIKP